MKIVLTADVKGSGKAGEIIEASEGYARNFLIPKGLAMPADKQAINEFKAKQGAAAHKKEVEKTEAKDTAERISKLEVTIKGKSGANGKLFGAITNKEIGDALEKEHGIKVDKKKIVVDETIKMPGRYKANIKVYANMSASLTVNVVVD